MFFKDYAASEIIVEFVSREISTTVVASPSSPGIVALHSMGPELLVLEDEPLQDADAGGDAVVVDEGVTLVVARDLG